LKEKNHQACHRIQLKHQHFLSYPKSGFNELENKDFTFFWRILPWHFLLYH